MSEETLRQALKCTNPASSIRSCRGYAVLSMKTDRPIHRLFGQQIAQAIEIESALPLVSL